MTTIWVTRSCLGSCLAGLDCNGICGGTAVDDECGVCEGSGPESGYDCLRNCIAGVDCEGVCGGALLGTGDGKGNDACGICNGDGLTCISGCTIPEAIKTPEAPSCNAFLKSLIY